MANDYIRPHYQIAIIANPVHPADAKLDSLLTPVIAMRMFDNSSLL